jgi:hypothetical protein
MSPGHPGRPQWLGSAAPKKEDVHPAARPLPAGPASGRSVFFYPNGTYYTSDQFKSNMPAECGDWYVHVLKDQLSRGVIDDQTLVNIPAVFSGPLRVLRDLKGF